MNSVARARIISLALAAFFHSLSFSLDWVEENGHRSALLQVASSGKSGFTLMESVGVTFTNRLEGDMFLTNAVAHNGSGVAVGDIDGDGLPDLYFCNLQGPNGLFRNQGGWRFDRVDPGPAACADQLSTGASFADVDGDHDLDLLVNGISVGTRLFMNDGKGRWTEAVQSGLSRTNSPTSMALADIDRDGDLDLYCAHYIDVMHLADPTTAFALGRRDGKWEVIRVNGQSTRQPKWHGRFEAHPDGSVRERPEVHALYRNNGNGQFTAIQNERGVFQDATGNPVSPARDWGLAVMFRDLNGDGAPDFYVCNDNASPDRLWINNGNGTFRAADRLTLRHTSRSSMGLDFADIDRDGLDDFIVVDMLARSHERRLTQIVRDVPDSARKEIVSEQPRYNRNTLFLGRPGVSFAETAFFAGVAATDWSWCPIFLDVDLDGFEDLLVSNGFSFDVMDRDSHDDFRRTKRSVDELKRSRQFHPRWPTVLAAYRNQHDGTFASMAWEWGFTQPGITYGMALGDLDLDGDLDLVANRLNEPAALYRNNTAAPRVAVRLKGEGRNSKGIGARITVIAPELIQGQEMIAGGRYMSGDEPLRVFAAAKKIDSIEVKWPDGSRSTIENPLHNRIYEVSQAHTNAVPAPKTSSGPFFVDASELIQHRHFESTFDDWAGQPLLPRKLSRLGPGLAWADLNADGWQDLVIGAGRGGRLALYFNEGGKSFSKEIQSVPMPGDLHGVLTASGKGSDSKIIGAISSHEMGANAQGKLAIFELNNRTFKESQMDAGPNVIGPMASADIDGDGDLDLFTGGRELNGRYPEPGSSSIWLNDGAGFTRDAALSNPFDSLGLVSGATFADLDNDGDSDLALALEWGPLRIFRNDSGRFHDATKTLGLSETSGLWTGIVAGDFNGDGKIDLAAGNWGRNTPYALHDGSVLRVFYGDFDRNGSVEIFEAWKNEERWFPIRDKTWLARGMPAIQQLFTNHHNFSKASISDILGERLSESAFVEAAIFESSIFLNRESHFERKPLPSAVQYSPVFSVNVGDFDGDGSDDLFLSQNFFGSASDLSREDSGLGLWLRGQGDGTFSPIDAVTSGIQVHGEQRAAALADCNNDGRIDVAISQNDEQTKLYLNKGARPGVAVTLRGPPENPDGVGAILRVVYEAGRRGPARVIQRGSGYFAQDSAVHVLGFDGAPVSIWVRWPGGREQTVRFSGTDVPMHLQIPY